MRIWSTEGFVHWPKRGEHFRLGPFVSKALWVTKWFVVVSDVRGSWPRKDS